ncbi:hypothetical protein KBD34_05660 [Patescibacteria group bacterium]|nr:hypothetical protein [Patescibacteria group bacterium]
MTTVPFPIAVAIAVITLVIGGVVGYLVGFESRPAPRPGARSFEECAAGGHPVMESYPRRCRTPDGQLFVEQVPTVPFPQTATSTPPSKRACATGGCSGQLCIDAEKAANAVSTCEFRAEYACYRTARCERQATGECGWTQTPALETCLENPPAL